ncbi:MAG TPA: hypothetical protein VFZ48_04290 [Candidatus Saccharimonadales bacterium]
MFYKNILRISVVGAVFATLILTPQAFAQQAKLTEKHIEAIRQNCLAAQVTMQRLQYTDAAARINRGSAYEALMSKLIVPFNSRSALNRLQTTQQLLSTTDNLERVFTDFKKRYTAYEEALSATLSIKCQDQPVTFYDNLSKTRDLRKQLATDITLLSKTFAEYQKIIDGMSKKLRDGGIL